jgi:hypothetical protein
MKTLDLLNIMTQVFIKVRIYIENEKNFLYEDYGYPLWKCLKYSTDWTLEHDRKITITQLRKQKVWPDYKYIAKFYKPSREDYDGENIFKEDELFIIGSYQQMTLF